MKLNFRGILAMLMVSVMCLTMGAALAESPSVTVDVTVKLEGSPLPSPAETYTIELKGEDGAPMPEGSADGVSVTTVTGAGTVTLPAISFERTGIYKYTISQAAGTNAKCAYDSTVYNLTVYITNKEDGTGIEATAVLYKNNEGDKLSAAVFTNVYPTVTPAPGDMTQTGVNDTWPVYLAGSFILLMVAAFILVGMRRQSQK